MTREMHGTSRRPIQSPAHAAREDALADAFGAAARRCARRGGAATLLLALVAVSCGPKPEVLYPIGMKSIPGFETEIARMQKDPEGFIRSSLVEARKLRQYTMHFQRQERLGGLIKSLQPVENMHAEYRDQPFSVRFTWLDEESEFLQCTYVDGREQNKVCLLPRRGLFGTKPSVQKYPPDYAVTFNRTRNPITDFGPRRMLERTIDRMEKAAPHGGVRIIARDAATIGPYREMCFHLELWYPPGDEFACKLQDLYISASSRLPVGTYLWLTGKDKGEATAERSAETLDAMYIYAGLDSAVQLSDREFEIDPPGIEAIKRAAEHRRASNRGADGDRSAALTDRRQND